jgi:hypothetical protein
MNDLLLSEISTPRQALLSQFSLLETSIFGQPTDIEKALKPVIDSCQLALADCESSMDKAEVFLSIIIALYGLYYHIKFLKVLIIK